jgi:H+-transporting ATPase
VSLDILSIFNGLNAFSSGTRVGWGTCEALVIGTDGNTFIPPSSRNPATGSLSRIFVQLVIFCVAVVSVFFIAELLVLYPRFHYTYHRGIDAIFVLLIGGIPFALPTFLSVTFSAGVDELADHGVLVTRIEAVEELARVTVLCVDSGVLTEGKLAITGVKVYGPFSPDEVLSMASFAHSPRHGYLTEEFGLHPSEPHPDIELLRYVSFTPVDQYIEVTYRTRDSPRLKRLDKGFPGHVIDKCSRNQTATLVDRVEAELEDCARRGGRPLMLAYEELEGDDLDADGNGFELIGMLEYNQPLQPNTQRTVSDLLALGVQVKQVTEDYLEIAKDVGRRAGLGDNMFSAFVIRDKVLRPGTRYTNLDELILDAAGFSR